jgi:dipeptidyl-peptidase-4
LYVHTFSNPVTPPQVGVHVPGGHRLTWIAPNSLTAQHPYWPYQAKHVVPEFGHITAEDGQALQYRLLKPPAFDPAPRYPVLIDVYGRPTVQQVRGDWPPLIKEYMAQQGYIVSTLDNRGSSRRGRRFSDPIHGRLGDVEVRDQLAGAHWLQAQP